MRLKTLKQKLMLNKEFAEEYKKTDLAFEIGQMVIEARIIKGITQAKLAKLVKTKQPSIARLEKGNYLPSLSFLKRIASALKTYLLPPKFAFMVEVKEVKQYNETVQAEHKTDSGLSKNYSFYTDPGSISRSSCNNVN